MEKNIAIVTGASGGLGREFVRLLSSENEIVEIWAVARDISKLEQLKRQCPQKIQIFSYDLSSSADVNCFLDKIKRGGVNIKYLINNAGYAKFGAYDDISAEESLNMLDLDIKACVAVGLGCIDCMRGGAHIINIASQASFQPLPYLNLYSASKAFLRNYTRALNVELKEKHITATAVCPSWMDTGLLTRGRIGARKSVNNFKGMLLPSKVAQKALKDAERGKDISICGTYTKFCHFAAKLLPQRIMMKLWTHQQKF